ncbi:MAG: GAF domain-containing protein [Chloroflexi bacterium]|nr:GAF domain-containing protein [Chloroflexota bacterium]
MATEESPFSLFPDDDGLGSVQEIMHPIRAPILAWDRTGRIIAASEGACALLGAPVHEIINAPLEKWLPEEGKIQYEGQLSSELAGQIIKLEEELGSTLLPSYLNVGVVKQENGQWSITCFKVFPDDPDSDALHPLRFAEILSREVEMRTRELRRRQQIAEGLRYILGILNSNRPLEEILQYIISQACWLLDTDAGAVYRLYPEEGMLTIRAERGLPAHSVAEQRVFLNDPLVARALEAHAPVFVEDTEQARAETGLENIGPANGSICLPGYRAVTVAPIITAHEAYGCIVLYFSEPRTFARDDLMSFSMLADHAALAIENARLRSQAEESAALAERNRLARELHDAVTQSLFSASILADVLPRIWEQDPEEGKRKLEELTRLNRGALAEMRALLMELRPKALTEVDLHVLLEHLTAAMQNRGQIPITLEVENPRPLPPDVQIGFYRIAQEALNNVVQHAGASQAHVSLRFMGRPKLSRVEMIIHDDGRGFDPSTIPMGHLGVEIMRERAESIDAHLEIKSEFGKGTTIHVTWPSISAS